MKKIFLYVCLGAVVGFGLFGFYYQRQYKTVKTRYDVSTANEKAWQAQVDSVTNQVNIFQYTVTQYKYMTDSISRKLRQAQKDLKIKDKNLKELQYLATTFARVDTLVLEDTIFVHDFVLDTVLGDEWIRNHVQMAWPNFIDLSTCVKSEKEVLIHAHRETINPPSKWFFVRWFQKKHEVIKVDVQEQNPYIESEYNSFYKIID